MVVSLSFTRERGRTSKLGEFANEMVAFLGTYIWNTSPTIGETKEKLPVEYFQASDVPVTVAIMAPRSSRQALDNAGDEIYDLCHPKKIVLLSREESNAPTPQLPPDESLDKKEMTPAYLEKSAHRDGQIIITADYSGSIKVFRQ